MSSIDNTYRQIQFSTLVKNSLAKGKKNWSKADILASGYTLEEVMPWLKDWEQRDLAIMHNTDDVLFEAKPYSKKKMLENGINRFYSEGSLVWSKDDIIKHELTVEEVIPWLREWEKKGYIKINGKDDNFFEVLKEIDSQKYPKAKKSLLRKGVILFLVSFVINAVFVAMGIGGILRELARLGVIVGFILIVVGAIMKVVAKIKK